MYRSSRALASVLVAAPLLAFACDAELESDCREGPCGGGLTDPGTTTGVCTTDDTHGLPCLVYQVIRDNCHECHVPGGIGPFTLLNYDDTQEPYGEDRQRWERMKEVIAKDNDGFLKMPLPDAEGNDRWPMSDDKLAIMNDWFATCVPDVGCDQVEEIGGAGGSGGSGGGECGGAAGCGSAGGAGGEGGN